MSLFVKQVRRVRDESLSDKTRLLAFVSAVNAFGWRTNQDAGAALDRLGAALGFDRSSRPSAAQEVAAIAELERERKVYVEQERGFALRRLREKGRGQMRV